MGHRNLVLITILVFSIAGGHGLPVMAQDGRFLANPAAVYCQQMGYRYEKRIDENGNAYGVSIFPDGSEAGAREFFRGRAGQREINAEMDRKIHGPVLFPHQRF